ncbi:MAG: hypothetical protein A3F18_07065 [Legionellales bacterium RIFCSPHIGHO2_12_FULL_37_14]|nr:MAG: hypothetical protein A3F18_07065 [Legionellales bacterium RIFCSPHIGHO2_12_FULL_37_14]
MRQLRAYYYGILTYLLISIIIDVLLTNLFTIIMSEITVTIGLLDNKLREFEPAANYLEVQIAEFEDRQEGTVLAPEETLRARKYSDTLKSLRIVMSDLRALRNILTKVEAREVISQNEYDLVKTSELLPEISNNFDEIMRLLDDHMASSNMAMSSAPR